MKKKTIALYIEGTTDDTNGDLRQGFATLLSQRLAGRMPRIRMADGKSQAISKFKRPLLTDNPILLIDLDKSEELKDNFLKEEILFAEKHNVFFMIQEMEAWFLSQPSILDELYNHPISSKIKRNPKEIDNPSDYLADLVKDTKIGTYHKVRHGVTLLKKLKLDLLIKDFNDVYELIKVLEK